MAKDTAPTCIFLQGANNSKMAEIVGINPASGQPMFTLTGNTDFLSHTHVPAANKVAMPVLWFMDDKRKVARPDIFVNCIADADGMEKSLAKVIRMAGQIRKQWPHVPIFNPPSRVTLTRRDTISAKCQDLPGLLVPKTVRCKPKSRDDVFKIAKEKGFTFPYIVRPVGFHNGQGMALVKSAKDGEALDALSFDGSEFFIIQFHDYKNAEGIYVKMRLVMIGNKVYARHAVMSRHWNVHATSREEMLGKDPSLRALEKKTLEELPGRISDDTLKSMQKIYRGVGLDYLGFDCSLLPDGRLLCFEINAAMNAMGASDYKTYPYLKPYTDAIVAAYNARLREKVAAAAAARAKAHA